jgi:EAL domain-containing protein (putative c-di-GMP-specific phosphodiesterase class I)
MRKIVLDASARGIPTVAVGVETREELLCAVSLGADYAQGFYLGKPSFTQGGQDAEGCAQAARAYQDAFGTQPVFEAASHKLY